MAPSPKAKPSVPSPSLSPRMHHPHPIPVSNDPPASDDRPSLPATSTGGATAGPPPPTDGDKMTSSSSAAAPPAAPAGGSPAPVFMLSTEDQSTGMRRPSVQFLPQDEAHAPVLKNRPPSVKRRMSSPPPPSLLEPRVSFDTMERVGELTSFSLVKKHKDYAYTKRSRTFLCGLDSNDYSEYALEWLVDELVDDGDEVVCLRVLEKDSDLATSVSLKQKQYREEAENLMTKIQTKNAENKAINLILEFAVGKVQDVIGDMIKLYEPAILIVGTRGRSLGGIQGLLPGSISKYCLQHSPVPVIVVRPNSKRIKKKKKRLHDPSRQSYRDLLYKAGTVDHETLSRDPSFVVPSSTNLSRPPTIADRDAATSTDPNTLPLDRNESAKGSPLASAENTRTRSPDPTSGNISPASEMSPEVNRRLMKSPDLGHLDSAESSDSDLSPGTDPVARVAERLAVAMKIEESERKEGKGGGASQGNISK